MNINHSWLGIYNAKPQKATTENSAAATNVESKNLKSMVVGNEVKSNMPNAPKRVDKIELSSNVSSTSSAFDLAKLKEKIVADITKDHESLKVEAVKKQINSNTYSVDPIELANIILQG